MDLGGEGVSVYAEAKAEYTKQLCQYLVPPVQQYFLDLLDEAKAKEADSKRVLLMFQTLLEDISNWNVDKVQRETSSIVQASHCDYLEELMTAVFIAHTKVLSAIRLTTKQKKLQITIPKIDHFVHRTLTECARLLWSNTYLFSTTSPSMERQKNLRQIENFLHEGVLQGIRGMLPVKNILREYLRDDGDEEEEKVDDAEEKEIEDKVEDKAKKEVEDEDDDKDADDKDAKVEVKEDKAKKEVEDEDDDKEVEKDEKPEKEVEKDEKEVKKDEKPEKDKVNKADKEENEDTAENDDTDEKEQVKFTGSDTLFDSEYDATEQIIDEVKLLDTPPEDMNEFEEIDENIMPMDFESLA